MNYIYAGADFLIPAGSSVRIGLSIPGLSPPATNVFMTFFPPGMVYTGSYVGNELHISDLTVICTGQNNSEVWYWATITNPNPFAAGLRAALNLVN